MNFTLVGGSGFIGRHLSACLERNGFNVWVPDREGDAVYSKELGHVIYCAGVTADFRQRPFDTMYAHVCHVTQILEKARFDSLLYLSTTRVYGRNHVTRESSPIVVDPAHPSDLYNISKLAGEAICMASGRRNVRIARLSNVVGYDHSSSNFLFDLIRDAVRGRIGLMSAADSEKDYILIDDAVDLLMRIAMGGRSEVYNVASGINIKHGTICEILQQLTGCEIVVAENPERQSFPVIDMSRVAAEFSFTPASVLSALPGLVARFGQSKEISHGSD